MHENKLHEQNNWVTNDGVLDQGVLTCTARSSWARLMAHRSSKGRTTEETNLGVIKIETSEDLAYT